MYNSIILVLRRPLVNVYNIFGGLTSAIVLMMLKNKTNHPMSKSNKPCSSCTFLRVGSLDQMNEKIGGNEH